MMKYYWQITRSSFVTKSTILTKRIMLGVVGWRYLGKSWVEFPVNRKTTQWKYIAFNPKGERIVIGNTMQEAEEFYLKAYKEYYDTHPEEHDWLPDPYNRKKSISKIIMVQTKTRKYLGI